MIRHIATFMSALVLSAVAEPVVRLWDGHAPLSTGEQPQDIPKLTIYQVAKEKATGTAIVVCPGGGYGGLAAHEGRDYALWLNSQGIHAFVLQYRLGSHGYRHPVMISDAARAVRWVRHHTTSWGVKKVGIMGSSAGGHLASTLLTHYDAGIPISSDEVERQSSKPDFGILCYPVITLKPGHLSHAGSRKNLLGDNPAPELIESLSTETRVTEETPPTFLWHTADDAGVPVMNSMLFASALAEKKVPHELHIYRSGRHGLGLGTKEISDPAKLHPWAAECQRWLQEIGAGEK